VTFAAGAAVPGLAGGAAIVMGMLSASIVFGFINQP
jgi:hypothetical protein